MIPRRLASSVVRSTINIRPLSSSSLLQAVRSTRSRPPVRSRRKPSTATLQADHSTSEEVIKSPIVEEGLLLPSSVEVVRDELGVIDNQRNIEGVKRLLAVPALVIARQLEMMNLFLGYEQANKYQILNPEGVLLGYMMEEETSLKGAVIRQVLKRNRPFKASVLGINGELLLTIRRPFSFINSKIFISVPGSEGQEDIVIGEVQQSFHIYKRRYQFYVKREEEMEQFAETDEGLMAWDFRVKNEESEVIGSINRNFQGFAKELFTDMGQYVVRYEGVAQDLAALPPPAATPDLVSPSSSSPSSSTAAAAFTPSDASPSTVTPNLTSTELVTSMPTLSFDRRAVILASAVSIDFDYFSRMSSHGSGLGGMPLWMMLPGFGGGGGGGGGEAVPAGEGGVDGGAAAGVGAAGEAGSFDGAGSGYNDGSSTSTDYGGQSETNAYGDSTTSDSGAGESMNDPWANEGGDSGGGEDGGTWSWGDLFPGDE